MMTTEARYAAALEVLRGPTWIRRPLAARGYDDGSAGWSSLYARFNPGDVPWAWFVFRNDRHPEHTVRIEVFPEDRAPHHAIDIPTVGPATVEEVTHDAQLPGLRRLLEGATVEVLRYRPGRRCTLKVGATAHHPPRIAKLFHDARGAEIDYWTRRVYGAAGDGWLPFRVPEPLGWDADDRVLWQELLPGGRILPILLGSAGPALARRVGEAAGSIPAADLPAGDVLDAPGQLERTARVARGLARRIPELESLLDAVLARLEALHGRWSVRLRSVHGAPHPEQWLLADDTLGLVDFDRYGLAEPELDCATFVAEVDFEAVSEAHRAAVTEAFIEGYEHTAGPLIRPLLEVYRQHKHLAKALRYARAVRPDGTRRACDLVHAIHTRVKELPR